MKKIALSIVFAGGVAGAALGLAGAASAAGGADATINGLTTEGYAVQLNGTPTAPLTACTVTDVHKDATTGGTSLTAYVDVTCPDGC